MPRVPRVKHERAIYHITARGNNRERIFFCDDDKTRYLETLKRYKEKYQILIYAYCLMDNHIHIIIDCNGQDISKIMQGLSLSYTKYVNRKYKRCGHLFQDRFKSEIIKTDRHMLEASRYIHHNPVKAQMVQKENEYNWSSFNIYMGQRDIYKIIDEDLILEYFSKNKSEARNLFAEYAQCICKKFKPEVENNKYQNRDKKVEVKGCSITSVINKVAVYFGVNSYDITLKYSKRNSIIKQITLYLISLKSKLSYHKIGQKFGISGSSVGHNIKRAVELVMKDIEVKRYFNLILQS